jgi:hypothetical protein
VDCVAEWALIKPHNDSALGTNGLPLSLQSCTDGDPSCDADGVVNDECRFRVAVCFLGTDARLPKCVGSTGVASYTLNSPRSQDPTRNPIGAANAAALMAALQTLTPLSPVGRDGNVYVFDPPRALPTSATCTPLAEFTVPLGSGDARTVKVRGSANPIPGTLHDRDKLRLRCVRR